MEKEIRPIVCERDLEYYENRLNKMPINGTINTNKSLLAHHLTSCKGKLVRVEICSGGCVQIKVGLLLDVGTDFISIRQGTAPISTAIPISNIMSITFIHNNDRRYIMKS